MRKKRTEPTIEDALISGAISAMTGSALLGGLVGGSILGGIAGDILGDEEGISGIELEDFF